MIARYLLTLVCNQLILVFTDGLVVVKIHSINQFIDVRPGVHGEQASQSFYVTKNLENILIS